MIRKRLFLFLAAGLASVLMLSSGEVIAQCSGRGGCGRMSTGSTTSLNSSVPYASRVLATNYPSSIALTAQIQDRAYAMAYQNAQRQRLAMIAREEQARPYRLARAEAKRAARAERIAARIAERDGSAGSWASGSSEPLY